MNRSQEHLTKDNEFSTSDIQNIIQKVFNEFKEDSLDDEIRNDQTAERDQYLDDYPFRNVSLPWNERVDDLVSRLTLEEITLQVFISFINKILLNVLRYRRQNQLK